MLFPRTLIALGALLLLLLGSAAAASIKRTTPAPAPKSIEVNNNFETDMNNDPIASTQKVGVYNLLYWTFTLGTLGVAGKEVTGIIPHTPSNVVGFSARGELMDGIPQISANYQTSQIDSFSLKSMYYGCSLATAETVATDITSCTITATAYNKANKEVATQTFPFKYTGGTTQQMTPGTFNSGFQNVYTVVFNVTNAATTVAQMDNVITILNEY